MKDVPWPQVDPKFSRAAGDAFPSSLPKVRIDGTTGETWILFFMRSRANEAGVYFASLSEPRPPLWLDCSSANALSPKVPGRS